MNIKSVEILNFGSFLEEKFDLQDKGITLISGFSEDNQTSNGSGKSTLIEALCWGLFGVTPKGLKSDSVINRKVGKNCAVRVNLEEGSNEISVVRARQHVKFKNGLFLEINGQSIQGKDTRETQEIIERQIGVDFKTFTNSVLFPQNSKFKFVQATDTEKKDILSDILNLNWIDEAAVKVKAEIAKEDAKVAELEAKEEKIKKESIIEMDQRIADLKKRRDEFEDKKKQRVEDIEKQIEVLNVDLSEVNSRCEKQLEDFSNRIKGLEKEKEEVGLKFVIQAKNIANKVNELEKELEKIKSSITGKDSIIEKQSKLNEKLSVIGELKGKLSKKEKELQSVATEKSIAEKDIEQLKQQITDMELMEGCCPTCKQEIGKEHIESCVAELNAKIFSSEKQVEDTTKCVEAIVLDIKKLEKLISYEPKILESINDCKYELKRIDDSVGMVEKINKDIEELNKNSFVVVEMEKEEKERLNEKIKKVEEDIANIDEIKKKSKEDIELKIKALEKTLDKEKSEQNQFVELFNKEDAKREEMWNECNELQKKVLDILDERSYLLVLRDLFSNKGLKSFILDNAVYELNLKADGYIDALFDGALKIIFDTVSQTKAGEMRQRIGSKVLLNGEESSLEQLSGGELKRVSIAVDLALSDLIANRSSKSFNVLFFDEVTENLDESGRQAFFHLMDDLAAKRDSIFMITHSEVLKSRFDNVLNIVKKNGVSSICR